MRKEILNLKIRVQEKNIEKKDRENYPLTKK